MIKRYITNKRNEIFEVLLDDEHAELFDTGKWYVRISGKHKKNYYVTQKPGLGQIHRVIMSPKKHLTIDHINGNGLDNRTCNLRICTKAENCRNSVAKRLGKTSKYKGVRKRKNLRRWSAEIVYNYKTIHIGYFDTELEAAIAYNEKALELFKEFSKLNILTQD